MEFILRNILFPLLKLEATFPGQYFIANITVAGVHSCIRRINDSDYDGYVNLVVVSPA